jgi:hypothetical protein
MGGPDVKSVYAKWREWQQRNGVRDHRYAKLYARLTKSPAARRCWRGY